MGLQIQTIGGYSEFGGNSTAVMVDDETIILDMGLQMEQYIKYTEDEDVRKMTYEELLEVRAVPNYQGVKNVKAIVPSHGHLDHIGAIPFASKLFPTAPIICTPYTAQIISSTIKDERMKLPNKLIALPVHTRHTISKKISVELVHITHSIPHAAFIVVYTPYGHIVYANDYKFDQQPVIGKKPDFKKLATLSNPVALVVESLYADSRRKTPSEAVAKQMLKDVMLGVNSKGKGVIVTTFSSHLARIKSIIELGKRMDRKIALLGRSLSKYVLAAERIKLIDFQKDVILLRHRDKIERFLKQVTKEGKQKYLLVMTGHQGEPKAMLSRLARGEHPYTFNQGDLVIFSCQVIPVEINKQNREHLESTLRSRGCRIFRDIHVSGHASREDHRDLLNLLKPQHIIPSHAPREKQLHMASLAKELGYKEEQFHMLEDGSLLTLVQ